MSTQKRDRKPNFRLVLIGLFLLIDLVAGGTYALNEAGLLGSTNTAENDGERMPPPDFNMDELAQDGTFSMPDREAHDEGGISSAGLLGLGKSIGQIAIIVAVVYYSQKLLDWLGKKFSKPRMHNQAA